MTGYRAYLTIYHFFFVVHKQVIILVLFLIQHSIMLVIYMYLAKTLYKTCSIPILPTHVYSDKWRHCIHLKYVSSCKDEIYKIVTYEEGQVRQE